MKFAFVFPGQGSQTVGMGRDFADAYPAACAVFDEVDDALGEKLSRKIWNGAPDELTLTRNAQPALMAVSMAILAAMRSEIPGMPAPAFAAGHSLGEYTALAAAGVFTIADTARLLRKRGDAMQSAVPAGEGAMLALLGSDLDQAARLAAAASSASGEVCDVANDNAPGQVVISGSKAACDKAVQLAADFGIRRAVPLPVSAPFHCRLMEPAAREMAEALQSTQMHDASFPIVANVTAQPVSSATELKSLLIRQVTGLVRWRESMMFMTGAGVEAVFEIGSGRVLSGLMRRIDTAVDAGSVGNVGELDAFGRRFSSAGSN